jgi:hypothetical protein
MPLRRLVILLFLGAATAVNAFMLHTHLQAECAPGAFLAGLATIGFGLLFTAFLVEEALV